MAARNAAKKEAPEPEAPEQPVPNAVLVTKNYDEQGNFQPLIQTLGDVQITEVQFILEAGVKALRKELGFDG